MAGNRVNEIDLLRFVAAIAVVLFHFAFRGYAVGLTAMPYPALLPAAKYGYLGVDLFFLISGFVIAMSAQGGGLQRFAVSRAARLYPAFWVCCTLSFLVLFATDGAGEPRPTWQTWLVNMTMLARFAQTPYIDGAYWSLTVELRFYALIGIVLLLGQLKRLQAWLAVWLAAAALVDCLPDTSWLAWPKYLLISDYAAYFIGGAIAYLIYTRGASLVLASMFAGSAGLALFEAALRVHGIAADYEEAFDARIVMAVVMLCFAVMLLVALRRTGWFARRDWIMLGALTYPLYLLHQRIGYVLFDWLYPRVDAHLVFWGCVAAMLAAAWLVQRVVEQPLGPRLRRGLDRLCVALRLRWWPRAAPPPPPDLGA